MIREGTGRWMEKRKANAERGAEAGTGRWEGRGALGENT
jgi:hypothetical protein